MTPIILIQTFLFATIGIKIILFPITLQPRRAKNKDRKNFSEHFLDISILPKDYG